MALQGSGGISWSQMTAEFGTPSGKNLGAFRVSQDVGELGELPLDTGIPQSGSISFSQFYNKKLNVVVDFHSGGTVYRKSARTEYDNGNVTYVGNFKSGNPPSTGTGSKVIIHVNKDIGSEINHADRCALRTGTWHNSATVRVDVGGEGKIIGAGGRGGNGGGNGDAGVTGSSALGVEHSPMTVHIRDGGYISAGYGGGGGGGEGYDTDKWDDELGSGGGGGGGAGLPGGEGGAGGDGWKADGSPGSDGTWNTAGDGGAGGNADNEAIGGTGGEGGSPGENANNGGAGQGDRSTGPGGAGGGNGAAVRRTNGSISITYTGETDNIKGDTNVNGVA